MTIHYRAQDTKVVSAQLALDVFPAFCTAYGQAEGRGLVAAGRPEG